MPVAETGVAVDFVTILRKATATLHAQLETTPLSKALLSDDVSLEDYTNYLKKMWDVIAFCEQVVFPRIEHIIPDINERIKLPLIERDLDQLNSDQYSSNTYHPFNNTVTTDFALGYMYVIEGSTLGGRVILKHLHAKLGISENNSGSFFAGYGALTGSAWKSFLQSLQLYVGNTTGGDEVIEGAKHAFSSIYDYFLQ